MTTFIKTKFNKSDDQTNIDNIQILQKFKIIIQNSWRTKMYVEMSTSLNGRMDFLVTIIELKNSYA